MRCKKCDYRLWNLPSRVCPECGQPFRPSEFEFPGNSVQFCCAHCNQSYYGTGEKGHLVPIEFECVSCHRHIHMDEMVLLPTEGIEEEQTKIDTMPWLERDSRSAIRAWFASVRMALVTPGRLIHTVPESTPVSSAVWFAFFSNGLIYVAGLLAVMVIPIMIGLFASTTPGPGLPSGTFMAISIAASFAGMVVAAYIAVTALMLLTGLVAHGLLRLTGRTECSLGRTYHAICYSSGANVPSAIPCAGLFFGWIWWLVSAAVMLKHGQKVHGGRAAFAVLTVPLLTIAIGVFGIVWNITTTISAVGWAASGQVVNEAVLAFAGEHGGRGPEHAIQLVANGYLVAFDLVDTMSVTGEEDVPLADMTLDKFEFLSDEQKAEVVQSAVDALPAGTIAHRLGDFVFTYHGIDLNTADPGLWLVIMSPDPDVNPTPTTGPQVIWRQGRGFTPSSSNELMLIAGFVDGHVEVLPTGSLSVGLAAQNTLRAKYDLPPLPDPATVTHAKPAVAAKTAPSERSAGD